MQNQDDINSLLLNIKSVSHSFIICLEGNVPNLPVNSNHQAVMLLLNSDSATGAINVETINGAAYL